MGAIGRLGLAILGNQLFGPWGGLVGSIAGTFLFPDQMQDVHSEGPKLNDFKFTGSSYGAGIPWVWGNYAVPGNVIWLGTIHPHEHTEEEDIGGKGGGGATASYTTYTYSVSFAVGLCKGPMKRILKVFMNNELVYDALNTKIGDKIVDPQFRFYSGSETQLPDSIMEAQEGAGNVPGYRGLCYLVFDELDITPFGNALPQIKVIIQAADTGANLYEATFESYPSGPTLYDIPGALSYHSSSGTIDVMDLTGSRSIAAHYYVDPAVYGDMKAVFDDELYFVRPTSSSSMQVSVFDASTGVLRVQGRSEYIGIGWAEGTTYAYTVPVSYKSMTGEVRHIVFLSMTQLNIGASDFQGTIAQWLEAPLIMLPTPVPDNLWWQKPLSEKTNSFFCRLPSKSTDSVAKLLWMHSTPGGTDTTFYADRMTVELVTVQDMPDPFGGFSPDILTQRIGEIRASDLDPSGGLTTFTDMTELGPMWTSIDGLVYDRSDDTIIVSAFCRTYIAKMDMSGNILWQFTNSNGGGVIAAQAYLYMVMDHEIRDATLPIVGVVGGVQTLRLLDTRTGTLLPNPPQNDIPVLAKPFGYISNADVLTTDDALLFIDRSDFVEVPVEDIIRPIAEAVHAAPQDFADVAGLTVNGYGMAHPMTAREAIAPIARLYQFDAVDVNGTLRWVRRGRPSVEQIPFDDMIRSDSSDSDEVVSRTRTQEVDLPQAISVGYADRTRDYEVNTAYAQRFTGNEGYETMRSQNKVGIEVPAAITADVAKRFAEINLMSAWNERIATKFSLPPYGILFDPGDTITLDIPGRIPEDVMIVKQDIGANNEVQINSISQDSAQYTSVVVADSGSGYIPPEIAMATRITAIPLPITLPADSLDNGRTKFIVALTATNPKGFARPVIVGRLRTDGTYESVGVITTAATYGVLSAELSAAPDESVFCFDATATATIDVRMTYGTLESITHAQLLDGANLAVVIRPDNTVELLQFETATLVDDNTYTLSGLIRGRRGTDAFARAAAPMGSRFILLKQSSIMSFDEPLAGLGNSDTVRLWYDGTDPAKGRTVQVQILGRELMPYAPVHVGYTRAANNDHAFGWTRRTRVGGDLVPFTGDVALSEDAEAYEVDISDGYTTKTYPVVAPTYTYTEAQRLLDGMRNGYGATVYQMSGQVGRGFPSLTKLTMQRADVTVLSVLRLAKPIPSMRVAEMAQLVVRQYATDTRMPIFTSRLLKSPATANRIAEFSAIIIKKVP